MDVYLMSFIIDCQVFDNTLQFSFDRFLTDSGFVEPLPESLNKAIVNTSPMRENWSPWSYFPKTSVSPIQISAQKRDSLKKKDNSNPLVVWYKNPGCIARSDRSNSRVLVSTRVIFIQGLINRVHISGVNVTVCVEPWLTDNLEIEMSNICM